MPTDLPSRLTDLRRSIMTMGAAVEQRVNQAVAALVDADIEAASTVRRGDDEIDRMEMDIEQDCLLILALCQPVASDLRMVLAVLRISGVLEHVADKACNIARRAIALHDHHNLELPQSLISMAKASAAMFSDAMEALADHRVDLARRIRASDERVDDLQREVFAWVQSEIPRHVECTAAAIEVLSVARKLERIGDLSTIVAEEVIFHVEGTILRHT
jgi:phosphate transport system protein